MELIFSEDIGSLYDSYGAERKIENALPKEKFVELFPDINVVAVDEFELFLVLGMCGDDVAVLVDNSGEYYIVFDGNNKCESIIEVIKHGDT